MRDPVLRLQSALTDRDLVLLGWLADHGVLTSFQIAHALFPSLNFAQRRLRQLLAVGVIDRFRPQRADGGSYPYHYVLAQRGYEVIAAQRGEDTLPRRDRARLRRLHLTSRVNLAHLLGVNDFFTRLAGYARTHPDAALVRWWSAGQLQRPDAFRHEAGDLLFTFTPRIRPDGHGIFTENQRTTAFFLEYDTGTETIARLVDKMPRLPRPRPRTTAVVAGAVLAALTSPRTPPTALPHRSSSALPGRHRRVHATTPGRPRRSGVVAARPPRIQPATRRNRRSCRTMTPGRNTHKPSHLEDTGPTEPIATRSP